MDDGLRRSLLNMLVASFMFALTGAIARILKDDYASVQLVLFRNVIGVGFVLYWLKAKPAIQPGGRPWLLLFRGFIGTMALYFFFYGVTTIGLPESITYQQSYPLFLAAISAWFLGQKLNQRAWAAIVVGFIGLCLIFIPKMTSHALEVKSHIVGLANLLMTGMAYLSIRGLSAHYDSRVIVLSFMLCGIFFPIVSMVIGSFYYDDTFDFILAQSKMPAWRHMPHILLLGMAALAGQVFLTRAFSHQNTGMVGAVGYSNIVFSILFGVLIGDAMPYFSSMVGITLIIFSGILISLQK
ncbi:MAG: DMT family transporter [Saprospiraceae bacterium]|nr:DMT family transporter [Saprospiraceae bacterium]